jgi:hypothetical protein
LLYLMTSSFGSGWNSWCFGGKSQWTSLNLVWIMCDCFIQRLNLSTV